MKFAVSAVVCLGIGLAVLRANPRRFLNQGFFVLASLLTIWLWSAHQAVVSSDFAATLINPYFPWHRANAAVAAFAPWSMWLLRESIVAETKKHRVMLRSLPWLVLGGLLVTFCYADSFAFADPTTKLPRRGFAYVAYSVLGFSTYLFLIKHAWHQMRNHTGIRYFETQLVALVMAIACLLAVGTTGAGNIFGIPALKNVSFCILFGALILAAWATTTERIYNVRQIFLSLGQRIALSLAFCITLFALWRVYDALHPRLLDLFLSITVITSFIFWLDRKSRRWLDLAGERHLDETRRAVIKIALKEPVLDKLILEFSTLLRTRSQCHSAALLFNLGEIRSASDSDFRKDRTGYPALCEMGWATPESIEHRLPSPSSADLHRFMTEHTLGAIVTSPRASQSPSLIIAVGRKTNQYPFTYPEIQRLQATAELMDNILTHSRLTMQAALEARVEHLAMMSRGLAHDLKNLITPISSFLVHSGEGLPAGGPAAEVHSAAQRSVRIMTDYVREALFFSERLSPHFEPAEIPLLFEEVRGITATRASQRKITLSTQASAGLPLTADSVLLQRMLANLVNNAIDASRAGQTVVLSATTGRAGWVRFEVTDHGCGIPSENLSRIFDPYFTTKEFGDDVRGFGLGLTICQKIVHLHGGTISVTSQSGSGTTILVELPVNPTAVAPAPTPASAPLSRVYPSYAPEQPHAATG